MTALATSSQDALLGTLLLDLAIIAALAFACGALARTVGQPMVIGEIVAGILLGPSLLGLLPGDLETFLFPRDVRPYVQILANVALVLFMFGTGFGIDVERIRRSGRAALRIGSASVLFPVVVAAAVAPALWAGHPPVGVKGVTEVQFASFLAIVLSITALPVLARMLQDLKLSNTPLGSLALVVAAMTDLVAWAALAVLTATLGATAGGLSILELALAVPGSFAVLLLVIRPGLRWFLAGHGLERNDSSGASVLLLGALALCAAGSTLLGLHPAFGAFALGVACPRRFVVPAAGGATGATVDAPAPDVSERAAAAVRPIADAGLVLVPLYFVVTGLKVDVTGLGLDGALEVCALLVVATAAKVVGVTWAAARSGLDRGRSLGLGVLLNTRGLTEVIVLGIGRDSGLIDGRLFSVLVLVSLLTTAMTMPILPLALRMGRSKTERVALHAYATEPLPAEMSK